MSLLLKQGNLSQFAISVCLSAIYVQRGEAMSLHFLAAAAVLLPWVRRKVSGPICWLESPRPVFALVCYWSAGSCFHFLWSLPVKHSSMERRSMWLSGAIQALGRSRLIHVPFREEASWEQPHESPTWRCIPQTCNTDPSLQHFQ